MMMADAALSVILRPQEDRLLVLGGEIARDRAAFLYLRASLGAVQVDGGWGVPRRRHNATWLIMRVHDWLVSHGYKVDAEGIADSAIAQELEGRRSFQRTRQAATAFKAGTRSFDSHSLERTLSEFAHTNWTARRTRSPLSMLRTSRYLDRVRPPQRWRPQSPISNQARLTLSSWSVRSRASTRGSRRPEQPPATA